MEQDLLEAKNYLSQQGYGRGTNYSTNLVVILLANYAQEKVKKLQQHVVSSKQPLCQCGQNSLPYDAIHKVKTCSRCGAACDHAEGG